MKVTVETIRFLLRCSMLRSVAGVALAIASFPAATPAQATYFVDDNATPGGNGLSWTSAYSSLDSALSAAISSDTIWLAEGTYHPTVMSAPPDRRSVRFRVPAGVTLIGGFLNGQPSAPPLGSPLNTILSGDIGVPGVSTDNAYHVVFVKTPLSSMYTVIQGVTIRDGRADGASDTVGGGLMCEFAAAYLDDCWVTANHAVDGGGGLSVMQGALLVKRCHFDGNTTAGKGGAMRLQSIIVSVFNAYFQGNSAAAGGALSITSMDVPPSFANCLFYKNVARTGNGGAAAMNGGLAAGHCSWFGCTFTGNAAAISGDAIYAGGGSPPAQVQIHNSIAWGNLGSGALLSGSGFFTVSYSDIEGGFAGLGNIDVDPQFTGSFALAIGSLAIDAGDNSRIPLDLLDLDSDGNTTERLQRDLADARRRWNVLTIPDTGSGGAPVVDMGAFEKH